MKCEFFAPSEQTHQAPKIASLESENDKLKRENAEIKARLDKIEKALSKKVIPEARCRDKN